MADIDYLSKEGLDRYDNKMKNYIGIELTKAEYDQLSEEEKIKGTYWITDYSSSGGSSNIELDKTLSVEGKAADAKAVGDAINIRQNNETGYIEVKIDGIWEQSILRALPPNTMYLYNNGNQYTENTGGWEGHVYTGSTSNAVSYDLNKDGNLYLTARNGNVEIYTVNGNIDLSNYANLDIAYSVNIQHNYQSNTAYFVILNGTTEVAKKSFNSTVNVSDTWHIDLSSIEKSLLTSCKIKIYLAESGTSTINVSSIKAYNLNVNSDGYIYKEGDEYSSITGGWETFSYYGGTSAKKENSLYIGSSSIDELGGFVTSEKIDVTNFTVCEVTFQPDAYRENSAPFTLGFGNSKSPISSAPTENNFVALFSEVMTDGNRNTKTFDISSLNGEYYIILCLRYTYSNIFAIKIY